MELFNDIKSIWKKYDFEIILFFCTLYILTYSLYRFLYGKQGSWSTSYSYNKEPELKKKKTFQSKGEMECKRVLENLFNKPFERCRPNFLANPVTGNVNLELDCYNDELKLAVEYNGIQHYKFTPYFHKNYEAFQNQKYRDYMKEDLCNKNNITLIIVPYNISNNKIQQFLVDKLIDKKYINV